MVIMRLGVAVLVCLGTVTFLARVL